MRARLGVGWLALLAACASPEPPPQPAKRTLLPVRLVLVPPPGGEWQLLVQPESGVVEQKTGTGDLVELQLPPGPSSLQLTVDGRVFERRLVLGRVGATEIWQLAGGRRL